MTARGARGDVAVTGVGLVTALGLDLDTVLDALLAGRTGIGALRGFDADGNDVRHGAEVDAAPLDALQTGKLRRADRTVRFAVEAARQALAQAGVATGDPAATAGIASIWGCGCGPAETLDAAHRRFGEKGPGGMRPTTVPNCMANSISAGVSIHYGLGGANHVVVSACTSSTNAIGLGFRMVRDGYADAVLCGGVDAFFDPFYYGVWNNLGVLSKIADPARAVRPFDADRAGTLLGEGAGALLLEAADAARARGAREVGRVVGYGETSDATHITNPSAEGQARAIRLALADAGATAEDLAYVQSHGTGTEANDRTEAASIRDALGDAAADRIPVGAVKSYFGHTLGASGAIETVVALAAFEAGRVPPNLNLDRPDPECRVRLVGAAPEPLGPGLIMKNSFGFGGGNGVLLLRRSPAPDAGPSRSDA